MEMIGDLRLGREFNASKSVQKLNGIISPKLANDKGLHPPCTEEWRFMQATSVQFCFNSKVCKIVKFVKFWEV